MLPATALRAGIDVELPGTDCYGDPLREALDAATISMADVDLAVGRALAAKFRLGLFEQPYVDADVVHVDTRTASQTELARDVARDSLILLRNDGVLPLAPPRSVAVIGPNAASARAMLGDYSYLAHVESLLEVLKSGRNVFAMPLDHGADVTDDSDMSHVGIVLDELRLRWPEADISHAVGCAVNDDDRSGFADAVAAAAASDVAVLVMGERSGLTDDCTTGESRDVASLDLPGVQEELVLAVAATGTPVVLVLIAGRPIGSERVHRAASAVVMAWLPGEEGASAIADALTGVFSPGGKLPVSYPRSSGQVPVFYGHKVSGGRSHWKGEYVDLSNEPLHPFGHGLSYSTFAVEADDLGGVRRRGGRRRGGARRRHEHRRRTRRRGGPVLQPRSGRVGDPAGARAARIRAAHARSGRIEGGHVPGSGRRARVHRPRSLLRRRARTCRVLRRHVVRRPVSRRPREHRRSRSRRHHPPRLEHDHRPPRLRSLAGSLTTRLGHTRRLTANS